MLHFVATKYDGERREEVLDATVRLIIERGVNAIRLAARCAEVDAVGRTAALLREGGAGRAALASEEPGDGAAE